MELATISQVSTRQSVLPSGATDDSWSWPLKPPALSVGKTYPPNCSPKGVENSPPKQSERSAAPAGQRLTTVSSSRGNPPVADTVTVWKSTSPVLGVTEMWSAGEAGPDG